MLAEICAPEGGASTVSCPSPSTWNKFLHGRWLESITICLYAAVVSFAIPYHEPWPDEAQAWQLARNLSLHKLFQTNIRYEGTPGLWYFLLWIMARLHVSYTGMHWICGAIAVASSAVLVLHSPFPRYLRLALPFTYFLLFQYAVVARSYVLAPLLLFATAIWWRKAPRLACLALGLLANVSLHTAVISGGLGVVLCVEQLRTRRSKSSDNRRELWICALILLIFYAVALWTAWPPHDLSISRVRGTSRAVPLLAILSLVYGLCDPWILSVPFWIAIAIYLRTRRGLLYLLPVAFFAIFSGAVECEWWHVGLLTPLILCILWITWPVTGTPPAWQRETTWALGYVAAAQILWSVYAIQFDHFHAYSPDLATARFLQPLVENGVPIAVTYLDGPPEKPDNLARFQPYFAVGILPYFDHNIFVNQAEPYWWWSDGNRTENRFLAMLPSRPPVIVAEIRVIPPDGPAHLRSKKAQLLIDSGYRLTNLFCGSMPRRFDSGGKHCHLIFRFQGNPPRSVP